MPAARRVLSNPWLALCFTPAYTWSLKNTSRTNPPPNWMVAERRKQLGETEFAEIHAVLLQDDRLFPGSSDVDVYVEFVASYLEMSYFAPQTLSCHFPGVRDWQAVNAIVRQDIDYQAVFERLPRAGLGRCSRA